MSLRTNRVLKVFAILLFSLEMIAPALISSLNAATETSRQSKHERFHSNDGNFTRLITSVVFEESNGDEERESKEHKSNLIFAGFDLSEAIVHVALASHQTAWVEQYEITASQPSLFTLFHSYII